MTSIAIRWGAPSDTGNYTIIKYSLEIHSPTSPRTATDYTAIGKLTKYEHIFQNLKSNTTYNVYVAAYNKIGKGAVAKEIIKTNLRPGWYE